MLRLLTKTWPLFLIVASLAQAKPQINKCGVYQMSGKLVCAKNCALKVHPGTLSETQIAFNQKDSDLLSQVYKDDLILVNVKFASRGKAEVDLKHAVQRVGFNSGVLNQAPILIQEWRCRK